MEYTAVRDIEELGSGVDGKLMVLVVCRRVDRLSKLVEE
jgi:hypothetical protein